jgi:hypothetical protein
LYGTAFEIEKSGNYEIPHARDQYGLRVYNPQMPQESSTAQIT